MNDVVMSVIQNGHCHVMFAVTPAAAAWQVTFRSMVKLVYFLLTVKLASDCNFTSLSNRFRFNTFEIQV